MIGSWKVGGRRAGISREDARVQGGGSGITSPAFSQDALS